MREMLIGEVHRQSITVVIGGKKGGGRRGEKWGTVAATEMEWQ